MQYIIDENGIKKSVVVPFSKWNKITIENTRLKNKLQVLLSIQEGIYEIQESKKHGTRMQTLSDFLNESNS
jgi:hypothetical protein